MIHILRGLIIFMLSCSAFFIFLRFSAIQGNNHLPSPALYKDYRAYQRSKNIASLNRKYKNNSSSNFISDDKIILLWTPYQGSYQYWEWFIGRGPYTSNCENQHLKHKCLISKDRKMTEHADVILFSIQDLKKVKYLLSQKFKISFLF